MNAFYHNLCMEIKHRISLEMFLLNIQQNINSAKYAGAAYAYFTDPVWR